MATICTKNRSIRMAFIVHESDMRRLDQILSELGEPRSYEVSTTDKSALKFDDIETFLQFPNPKNRSITALTIKTPWGHEKQVIVHLRHVRTIDTVEYSVSGSEADVFRLSYILDEWIAETKPWYSILATVDFILFLGFSCLIVVGMVMAVLVAYLMSQELSRPLQAQTSTRTVRSALIELASTWWPIITIALGALVNILRDKVFPVATFAIGYGSKRHQHIQYIRNTLGIGLGLPLLIAIVAGWFSP